MARCMSVFVCLVALCAGATSAEAQYFGRNKVRYNEFDFRVIQTAHFDIYYYAEEETATRHAARMAERWYARFSRVLNHSFARRQPLVLYANHPHFSQTNVTPAVPGEATGGLTERAKARIAMPFAAGLGATDHVLGHEIAHAFQIDIVRRAGHDAFSLPGWFIEGMAEYLSIGPGDPHTAMWIRDAAVHDRLPGMDELEKPYVSPYRFGHALWSYVAGRYGDEVLGRVLRSKVRGAAARLEHVTGMDRAQLTRDWHASIPAAPEDRDRRLRRPTQVTAFSADGARLHVAPALSPDGRQVMFMSERDRLSLDLFMADAATGRVIRKVVSTAADPHFDSLQYIRSSGAWDADGRRFAIAALIAGRPVLVLVDVAEPDRRTEIPLDDLGEIYNPSWSPDGTRLVFSVLKGGLSDLFLLTLADGAVRQLTADIFADLHPAWSPDGRTIALATDRFTTHVDRLEFGPLRVGLLDLESGAIRPLRDGPGPGKQVSPQWAPDGGAVYFIGDPDGVSNVYRADLGSGSVLRLTDVRTGVSGITATSPALAVASRAGTLAFSVYRDGEYQIELLDARAAREGVEADAPQASTDAPALEGSVPALLADSQYGLPGEAPVPSVAYDDRLRLESVAPPFVGAASGNGFGGVLRAFFGLSFADTLRDRQVQAIIRLGTDVDDLALQLSYMNRRGQWNWGVAGGLVPSRFVGARRAIARVAELVTRETEHLRYTHQWGKLAAHYHLNRAQRLEFGVGMRRTGLEWQTITRVIDASEHKTVSRSLGEAPGGRPILVAEADTAFVHDTAISGPTSPVLGQRLRLAIEPALGGLNFADVHLDARRYFMPIRPVTIAVRAEHVARYGRGGTDPRLTPLIVGLQTRVRGYDLRSFAADECGPSATFCSAIDELAGSRLGLVNVELRAPIAGLLAGDLRYGRVPVEAIAFVDAGFLWTHRPDAPLEHDRFRSAGAGGRINIGGFVFEVTGARRFDGSRQGWTTTVLMRPGW